MYYHLEIHFIFPICNNTNIKNILYYRANLVLQLLIIIIFFV